MSLGNSKVNLLNSSFQHNFLDPKYPNVWGVLHVRELVSQVSLRDWAPIFAQELENIEERQMLENYFYIVQFHCFDGSYMEIFLFMC